MINYALIGADGLVVNVLVWDGVSQIQAPEGVELVQTDTAGIGWTYADGVFLPPATIAIPLDQEKLRAWGVIQAERDRRTQTGGYKVGGKWFHSDMFSRLQQIGLVELGASIPPNTQWKTMDGTFIAMTATLARQILAAGAASDIAIFATAEAHKSAMEASTKPSQYDYSAGWPKIYGE